MAKYSGNDTDTKLLLHCEGADQSTTFTDASIAANGNATVVGTAQVDTAAYKFGLAALLLDGNSDYLTYADSANWDVLVTKEEEWTLDCWVKHTDHAGTEGYMSHFNSDNSCWKFYHVHGTGLAFELHTGASATWTGFGDEITDTNWHHIAICKVYNSDDSNYDIGIYLDGTQGGNIADKTNEPAGYNGVLYVGATNAEGTIQYLDGHMDEIRIQKSNYFLADPKTGSDVISVPPRPYGDEYITSGGVSVTNDCAVFKYKRNGLLYTPTHVRYKYKERV